MPLSCLVHDSDPSPVSRWNKHMMRPDPKNIFYFTHCALYFVLPRKRCLSGPVVHCLLWLTTFFVFLYLIFVKPLKVCRGWLEHRNMLSSPNGVPASCFSHSRQACFTISSFNASTREVRAYVDRSTPALDLLAAIRLKCRLPTFFHVSQPTQSHCIVSQSSLSDCSYGTLLYAQFWH